jgi:hypothetical protein
MPLFKVTGSAGQRKDGQKALRKRASSLGINQLPLLLRLLMAWEIKLYFYSAMPEVSMILDAKEFWVVFYTTRSDLASALEKYQLRLRHNASTLELTLNADPVLSWTVTAQDLHTRQELHQVHLAFVMPEVTYKRACTLSWERR